MRKFFKIVSWVFFGIVVSMLLSVLYYAVFASIFSSDVEKSLTEQVRMYEKYLPQMRENVQLMEAEIEFLKGRDEHIYRSVFKAEAPAVSEMIRVSMLLPEDEKSREDAVKQAFDRSGKVLSKASRIEACWREVFDSLASARYDIPPMLSPVEGLNYRSVGASVGEKLSPFYKLKVSHEGLDIIAPAGAPVYATAPGVVTAVQKASGGKGNMVTITHSGGYVTRYAHMSEVSVKKGRRVKSGERIGAVGDSGRSFTTHLHYEVLKDDEPMDPNDYVFASVTPEEYLKILIKSAASAQSMD